MSAAVTTFTLLNSETKAVISDPVADGASFDPRAIGRKLTLRANCDPCKVFSVQWEVNGVRISETNDFPYAILGLNFPCEYVTWSPSAGTYTIRATPYFLDGDLISAGTALEIDITFTEGDGGVPQSTSGWTTFTDDGAVKKIYVSWSSGSDSNDGLTTGTPVKTLSKARSLMRGDGNADWIHLKRGDTWDDGFSGWSQSGKSAEQPAMVTYYGASGARPRLTGDTVFSTAGAKTIRNVAVVGLDFYDPDRDPASGSFDVTESKKLKEAFRLASATENFLIEGCNFSYLTLTVLARADNFSLRRNTFPGDFVTGGGGIAAKGYNCYLNTHGGALQLFQNIFDYGGWHHTAANAGRPILSHNVYCSSECGPGLIKENIFCRGGNTGCQLRGGGDWIDNIFIDCAATGIIGSIESTCIGNVCIGGANNASQPLGYGFMARLLPKILMQGNISTLKNTGVGGGNAFQIDLRDNSNFIAGQPDLPLPVKPQIQLIDNIAYKWNASYRILQYDGTLKMSGNDYYSTDTVHQCIEYDRTTALIDMSGGHYYNTSSNFAKYNGSAKNFAGWQAATGDTSANGAVTYPDPDRDVASYHTSIGGSGDLDDFMTTALAMWKESWDDDYTAHSVNEYIRGGFGL